MSDAGWVFLAVAVAGVILLVGIAGVVLVAYSALALVELARTVGSDVFWVLALGVLVGFVLGWRTR